MPKLSDHPPMAEISRLAGILPPFPKIVLQLLDLLRDEEFSLDSLARTARHDPVISGKLLAIANHLRRLRAQPDLVDPFAAASLVGVNRVRGVVVAAGMNRFLAEGSRDTFFFSHSLAVAIAAHELALLCGVPPEEAYIAGILHDIGHLCFHVLDAKTFHEAYRRSIMDGRLLEREVEIFGLDHCQIGARLAEHWNLPPAVQSAILTHHDAETVTGKLQATVCLAETLAHALDLPPSPNNRVTKINPLALETLGLQWHSPEMLDCFGRCRALFRQALGSDRHPHA